MEFFAYHFGMLHSTKSPQQVFFTLVTAIPTLQKWPLLCFLPSTHLLAWATGSGNTDSMVLVSDPKVTQTSRCPPYSSRADTCRGRSAPRGTSVQKS